MQEGGRLMEGKRAIEREGGGFETEREAEREGDCVCVSCCGREERVNNETQ